ncbi:unnamed protein product [Adineta steineri]|uniref:Uncharacterized protein n=1 Tax=Adineta steineri TaxID=433720 RepID=A0A815VU50_9BILA|nr:unnamed protein product [Adineta steineri]CAF1534860.1 unnamed protein product [Adineta steineri]
MHFFQTNLKGHRRLRWERFWPASLINLIAIIELLLTGVILCLEFWSMITNIRYSFFFLGFIASFISIITWISTFPLGCCCRNSSRCATYVLILHIISIAASSVLLYYDISFLRNPYTCLWPKNLCNEGLTNLKFFNITINASQNMHWIKFTLIKIQIGCAAAMIATCLVYILIYIYTNIRVYAKNTVADPHTTIELGRIQSPPPPHWPEAPRESLADSEF